MATHSSVLAWRIQGRGSLGAAVYGVAQSRTRLKRLSSSSYSSTPLLALKSILFCFSIDAVTTYHKLIGLKQH